MAGTVGNGTTYVLVLITNTLVLITNLPSDCTNTSHNFRIATEDKYLPV